VKKKILLIAFKYPPFSGVGGFRWSKLSKYLAQLGHELHVVTVVWQQYQPNTLLADVEHPNIHIHRIQSNYPHNLRYRPITNYYLNFLRKSFFYLLNRFLFYDDEAQYWGRYLLPVCQRLIADKQIEVIIATGHPFQANRWAAVLKKANPQLTLIQDFRDPWVDNPLRSWPKSKRSQVEQWQTMSIETADCVVSVTNGLLDLLLSNTTQTHGLVIRNGYDDENLILADSLFDQKGFSFVYIGNLFGGREKPLNIFLNAVRQVKSKISNLKISVVGGYSPIIKQTYQDLIESSVLVLRSPVSQHDAFQMVKEATYALHFNAKEYPYALSTKIYEYGMLKTPTVSFNYGGEIETLIRQHSLGYSVNVETDNIAEFLVTLHTQNKPEFRFDITSFSYRNLAKQYSTLINDCAHKAGVFL